MSWSPSSNEKRVRELEDELQYVREMVYQQPAQVGAFDSDSSSFGIGSLTKSTGNVSGITTWNPLEHRRFHGEAIESGGSTVSNAILVKSTAIKVIPKSTENPILIRDIRNAAHDGQIIVLTPKNGKTLTLAAPSGGAGNINIASNISVSDDEIFFLQWQENSPIATSSGGSWVPLKSAVGGEDNLGDHVMRQSITVNASDSYDIGTQSDFVRDLFVKKIRFGVTGAGTSIATNVVGRVMNIMLDGIERFTLSRNTSANSILEITGSNTTSNASALKFLGTNIPAIANMLIGDVAFDGINSAQVRKTYCTIRGGAKSVTSGSEEGKISFLILDSGVETTPMKIEANTGIYITSPFVTQGTLTNLLSANIFLGLDSSSKIYLLGRINTNVEPVTDNASDLGSSARVWRYGYFANIAIPEKYGSGAQPGGQANTAILFTRDNGSGKTQLRVKFNTGTSVLLATEP